MGSHPVRVEFTIEISPTPNYTYESLNLNTFQPKQPNGIRRTQRCYSFPNWRLHCAAASPSLTALNQMEEWFHLGADVNSKDSNARTALHHASKAGNLVAAAYLVSQGADVDARDDHGATPLFEAAKVGHVATASYLVSQGADVDARDDHGSTPLFEAAKAGNMATASYLVSQGADMDARDDHGTTPLVLAVSSRNNDHLARLLLAKRRRRQETSESSVVDSRFWMILVVLLDRVWSVKHELVKWFIVVANVVLEVCQAVVSEEAGGGSRSRCWAAGLSLVCVGMSIGEVVYEARRKGAKWRKRRGFFCFYYYYLGIQGRVFGSFILWFGLISSVVQLALNGVALVVERMVVKFDYLALLLAVCLLFVALMKVGGEEVDEVDNKRRSSP